MPTLSAVIDAGMMNKLDGYGWSAEGSLYFQMAENDATDNTGFCPTSASTIKLIRDGSTNDVANTAVTDMFFKANDAFYELKFWPISYKPMQANDILVVEGDFYNETIDTILRVTKTYILLNEDGTATFSATEPETVYQVGELSGHESGGTNTGIYATGLENDAPYSDWAAEYAPTSKECIQIIRGNQTIYRENTGAGAIIKLGGTGYYVKFDTWIDSTNYPLQAGDIIIIEGDFVGTSNYAEAEGVKIHIDKTYITYDGTSFTFVGESSKYINAGNMTQNTSGNPNWFGTDTGTGIYFSLAPNAAPAPADTSDWSYEYKAVNSGTVKLIRDGVTKDITVVDGSCIIKLSDTLYWFKLDSWLLDACGGSIQDGDILVIDGAFTNASNGYTIDVEKTYVTNVNKANDNVVFSKVYNDPTFGDIQLPIVPATVNIGVWNGSYHLFTDDKLAELKDAGVSLIIGIDPLWIGSENNKDMDVLLDRMERYGIGAIAYARNEDTVKGGYINADWDGTTMPAYADHPNLVGFIVADEPTAKSFETLATLKGKYESVMPSDKLFFVNLYSNTVGKNVWNGGSDWENYFADYEEDYVDAYISQINSAVVSWDYYSLIVEDTDTSTKGIRTSYFGNFEIMAKKSTPAWYTLLSAGHPSGAAGVSYATPTLEELRWQMAVAMTYGISDLDHYVYTSGDSGYTTMVEYEDADGDGVAWETTELFDRVSTANKEIKAWEDIYMAYEWEGVGVHDNGSTNTMLSSLENELTLSSYGISNITSNEDLLVGVFQNNGNKAYMITNAGSASSTTVGDGKEFTMKDTTVTLNLSGSYRCVAVIDQGEVKVYSVNDDGAVQIPVDAYEGVFVIPVA